jgi:hypothetical protein
MGEMSDSRRDYALFGGIVAVALFVVAFVAFNVIGDIPDRDTASSADFARYFQEEDGSIWFGSLFGSLAVVAFLFYVGALRGVLGGSRMSGTILGGGIAIAALMLANIAPGLSGAILVSDRDAPIDPQTATTLLFLGDGFFVGAVYGAAVFVVAAALAGRRAGVFPRWLTWVSLLLGLLLVLPFIGFLGFVFLFPLWIIGTTLLLWSRAATAAAPAI